VIGDRLREVRTARELSLNDVAERAEISVATLSRIERGKQAIAVALLVTLSHILKTTPHELFGEDDEEEGDAPIVRRIASMTSAQRTRFWHDLAETRRTRARGRRAEVRVLTQEVEELLAQVDFLREEIDAVRKRLRRG
jgi:transcriptional regulator with XRE-family HTH domain